MQKTVLVTGLGLIGGSLAVNLQRQTSHKIIGCDVNESTLEYSLMNGIIDEAYSNFEEAALLADYIILGAPVSTSVELIKTLQHIEFKKDVIVTDVSSVKGPIMETASVLTNSRLTFIGGHPMAGSHKKGIQAAKEYLFENAIYILTPLPGCKGDKVEELKSLLASTKSKFLVLEPKEHDEMTSVISHFPHLIASSLVHQAKNWQEKHAYLSKLAAGGFRDITRIASSNPDMWQDIFFHNRQGMARLLADWIEEMRELKTLLQTGDRESMYEYLEQAKEYRDGMEGHTKGAIPSFYDLYVDIRDQPGALLKVMEQISGHQISINNIEILEIREGITGVLRLSFQTETDQKRSESILKDQGYETMIYE